MPNITRSDLRQVKAKMLVSALTDSKHSLYLGVNGTAPWDDEFDPPQHVDTANALHEFWDHLVGFVKIEKKDTWMAIRHVRWLKGRTFQTVEQNVDMDTQMRHYCVNKNYEVYQCVSIERLNGEYPEVANEPIGHGNGHNINTGDGYVWKFLYELSSYDIANKVSPEYIPAYVNPSEFTTNQKLYGEKNVAQVLNVHHVGSRVRLVKQPGWTATHYRQYGLFVDIRNKSDLKIATAATLSPADVLSKSGYLVYTENIKKTSFEDEITDVIDIVIGC